MMSRTISHLIISELHTASSYLERIFSVIVDYADLNNNKEIRSTSSLLNYEVKNFIQYNLLKSKRPSPIIEASNAHNVRNNIKHLVRVLDSLLALEFCKDEEELKNLCQIINTLLKHAAVLHKIVEHISEFSIQFPRVALAKVKDENEKYSAFYLNFDSIKSYIEEESISNLESLQWQREKKYEKLIHQGHEYINQKEYNQAMGIFEKARNYLETAEVLGLIAWTYGLKDEKEKAKSFCLKAINKDPNYGPPYNDLGSYLLAEGEIEESIKWFELAKKALNYQNREYPYINCGRAYMAKREISKALDEFGMALTLAPQHEDLHLTIKRLKQTLEKTGLNEVTKRPPPLF